MLRLKPLPEPRLKRRGRDASERKTTMTEKEINRLADRLSAMGKEIRKAQKIAFDLAKDGNANALLQLRGAVMGTAETMKELEDFLTALNRVMGNFR